MKYPKIQTLWNRSKDAGWKVIPGVFRWPEFGLVKHWLVTEKIDGRNHRVILHRDGTLEHRGRTDRAQFSKAQMEAAERIVTVEQMHRVFDANTQVVLYGELYGPSVQNGGKYRNDIGFRLFDVLIEDWWMQWDDVEKFAHQLGLQTVPVLAEADDMLPCCADELGDFFDADTESITALVDAGKHTRPEGIVARTNPILCNRRGDRIMWKLKFSDFN